MAEHEDWATVVNRRSIPVAPDALTDERLAAAVRDGLCHGIVVRDGVEDACLKLATSVIDGRGTEDETYWPACAYHAHRWGRGRVVPLEDIMAASQAALLDEVARLRSRLAAVEALADEMARPTRGPFETYVHRKGIERALRAALDSETPA